MPALLRIFCSTVFIGCAVLMLNGCSASDSDTQPPPPDAEVYEDVRGAFQAPATGGRDMIVHHESIPDVMDAMLMTVPVDRPGSLDTLATGTPITFDLHMSNTAIQARNIRVLPDTVTLDLPADADSARAPTDLP